MLVLELAAAAAAAATAAAAALLNVFRSCFVKLWMDGALNRELLGSICNERAYISSSSNKSDVSRR